MVSEMGRRARALNPHRALRRVFKPQTRVVYSHARSKHPRARIADLVAARMNV